MPCFHKWKVQESILNLMKKNTETVCCSSTKGMSQNEAFSEVSMPRMTLSR